LKDHRKQISKQGHWFQKFYVSFFKKVIVPGEQFVQQIASNGQEYSRF
jgi:hypothetical protein